MHEITHWLRQNGLEQYSDVFVRHAIGFDVLGQLSDSDFSELGIAIGDRYRLKKALSTIHSEESLLMDNQAHFRQLTVLFSDLVGSTRLSTQLDAEQYRRVMQRYHQTVATVMNQYDGTVTNFEGDGVMVLFGFPLAHEDVPDRAVCAAMDSVVAVAKLQGFENEPLQSRIGIATGEVVVGDQFGVGLSRHFAVSGSTPNLAARLQTLAESNGIVASDATIRLTKTAFNTTQLPPTQVKGIPDAIQAFAVDGAKTANGGLPVNKVHRASLIARKSEYNQLKHNWQSTLTGTGMVSMLLGEAGIGKSRLVEEFIQDLSSEQLASFSCLPRYQNSMLHPLIEQLRDSMCLSALTSDAEIRNKIVKLPGIGTKASPVTVAAFESLLSLSGEVQIERTAKIKKEELIVAILQHLKAIVANGVSVIVVEDLQWADPTSLELLGRITQIIDNLPLLLLLTVRPDGIPAFAYNSAVNIVKLSPLTMSDSSILIEELSQSKLLSARDTSTILERCDGIPLYLEEITRAVMDEVDVSILERHATGIPETLRDVLMARLDRLGSGTLLAQIASVLGRRFTVLQVQLIAELDNSAVEQGLADLQRAGVLKQLKDHSEPAYEFNHSLTANAAYTSLLSEHKVLLHAKVARMLDADPLSADREPETAAGHYEWAGELEPAIRLRELAGNRASVRSANVEAAFHFNKAVSLAIQLPDDATRKMLELRLRLVLGTELIACYGNAAHQVESNFERARELCEEVPDQPLLWETLYGLWSIFQVNGRLREANTLGQQLIDLAARLGSSNMSLRANRAHGLCQFAMGKFEESRLHLEHAIELYDPKLHDVREMGDISDNLVLAKCNLGWLYCFQGHAERALQLHNDAIRRAEQLEHKHSLAFALALSAASHQALDDRKRTRQLAQRLVSLSNAQGYPYWLAWGTMLFEWATSRTSPTSDANKFDTALDAYEETGGRMMNAYFMTLRAELDIEQNMLTTALSRLAEAEKLADETAARFYMAEIPRLRAAIYTQRGENEDAKKMLQQADRLATRQGNQLLKHRIANTQFRLLQTH